MESRFTTLALNMFQIVEKLGVNAPIVV